MVIRNEPMEREKKNLVKICDDKAIHELATMGLLPRYITNSGAYYDKNIIAKLKGQFEDEQ